MQRPDLSFGRALTKVYGAMTGACAVAALVLALLGVRFGSVPGWQPIALMAGMGAVLTAFAGLLWKLEQ